MCNNIKKGLVILANAFICVIIVVFSFTHWELEKRPRAHVWSQDNDRTARTQMLRGRGWISPHLYSRFLAQSSFFSWHIFVPFFFSFPFLITFSKFQPSTCHFLQNYCLIRPSLSSNDVPHLYEHRCDSARFSTEMEFCFPRRLYYELSSKNLKC